MLSLRHSRSFIAAMPGPFPSRLDLASGARLCDSTELRTVPPGPAKILSIGDDSTLLYSRRLILETVGYVVESARGDVAIEEVLQHRIDLVLLCHSIAENVADRIVEASARIAPQTPVLQISPFEDPFRHQANMTFVAADPTALLSAVAGHLANQKKPVKGALRVAG